VLLDQPLHNLVPSNIWLAAVYDVNLHKFFILLLDELEYFFGVEINVYYIMLAQRLKLSIIYVNHRK
jgi:hypothetical protein